VPKPDACRPAGGIRSLLAFCPSNIVFANMTPLSVIIRGFRLKLRTTLLLSTLAMTLSGSPAEAKSRSVTPTPTPSTLPPTSPLLALPATGPAETGDAEKLINSDMSGRDLEFLTDAVNAGRAQAFYLDLLRTRAASDQIKSFADSLTGPQDDENRHLAALAAKKGWKVSMGPTAALKKSGAELEKLPGADFDKAALDKLATASHDALKIYQVGVGSQDKDIKTLAAQLAPLAEEKRHVVQKMLVAGTTATRVATPAPPLPTTPSPKPKDTDHPSPGAPPPVPSPVSTPSSSPPPASTTPPPASPSPTPTRSKSAKPTLPPKVTPTPRPIATPTPPASAIPIATPPGIAAPHPLHPPILPPTISTGPSFPAPIPPPISPSK
jgi:predicted outer membrane protein